MKLSLLLLSIFVTLITGAPSEFESRILGGTQVTDPKLAYYVAAITVKGEHVCTGFIYKPDWVVTAASCVNGVAVADVKITVGMTSQLYPNNNQADLTASAINIHPSYDATIRLNDIALIQTTGMVISDYVNVKAFDEDDGITKSVTIMGWGATSEGGLASLRLRSATLELVDTCTSSYGNTYRNNYMICAGSPSSGTVASPCQYDEGSPIVQNQAGGPVDGVVIGIMSRNVGCGTDAGAPPPTVFTRVASYFAWLRTTTTVTVPTPPCIGCA